MILNLCDHLIKNVESVEEYTRNLQTHLEVCDDDLTQIEIHDQESQSAIPAPIRRNTRNTRNPSGNSLVSNTVLAGVILNPNFDMIRFEK